MRSKESLRLVGSSKKFEGGDDSMESRVTRLETSIEYIQRDMSEIKADLKDVKKEIGKLPYWLIGTVLTVIFGVGGIMLAIVQFYQAQNTAWLQHFLNQLPK